MKRRASTKKMVEIKEKLKLDRSASNAQAANGGKFNLLHEKEEKIAKGFKIVLAEKPNLQEAAEQSRNNWQNEQKQE